MKAKAKFLSSMTLGLALGLVVLTQVAHAADFNPQPDPPVQGNKTKGLLNPPSDKTMGQHNPPGDKGALVDLNQRAAKGAGIDPNDKAPKGLSVDPNDKKH